MAKTTEHPVELGSITDAATILGVNPRTVRRLISRGDLAAYRVGSTSVIRVDLAQARALLRPIPTATPA